MPSFCIKRCGVRKNINQPNLTLHRFSGNEILKKDWIEAIGSENTNPRHKMWHVCSMHFDESCFNRTLDVIRLHDGAVPTSTMLIPNKISKAVLREKQNTLDSTCPLKLEFLEENITESVPSVKIQMLIGGENNNSLIFQKSRGDCQYASIGVVNIIKKTENLIKPHLTNHGKPEIIIYTF